MKLICMDCETLFNGPSERCPKCGGADLAETGTCDCCHQILPKESMHGPFCDECTISKIDYDTFLGYATQHKSRFEMDELEYFVFAEIFGIPAHEAPRMSSPKLKDYIRNLYQTEVENEKLMRSTWLIEAIRDYMSSWSAKDNFIEWLMEQPEYKQKTKEANQCTLTRFWPEC